MRAQFGEEQAQAAAQVDVVVAFHTLEQPALGALSLAEFQFEIDEPILPGEAGFVAHVFRQGVQPGAPGLQVADAMKQEDVGQAGIVVPAGLRLRSLLRQSQCLGIFPLREKQFRGLLRLIQAN